MDELAALLAILAAVFFALAATLMKPVVEDLHAEGLQHVLASWELWVMAVAGLVGFYLQQVSLATGRLVPSVATVSVANPVVSVLLGVLVLQERLDQPPAWHAVVAVGGLATALLGAIVVASATEEGAAEVAETPRPVAAGLQPG